AQELSNLVYRPGDRGAGRAGFDLALDLDERAIGRIKSTGEDGRDVERGRRIACKQRRSVGDVERRTLEGPYVRGVGQIQKNSELAEYGTRLGNPDDLRSLFDDLHRTLPEKQQLSGGFANGNHHLSGL